MLSVFLSFVMVITSLPIMMTQAAIVEPGEFDPTPYWSLDPDGATKKDAKEIMFSAVLNADNSIDVYFPRAFSVDFKDGDPSTPATPVKMMGYIVTLTEIEDGQTNKNPILEQYYPLANVVQNDMGDYARQITIKAEDVEKAIHLGEEDGGFKTNTIYDIGVTAVDNEYWTSETIHTVLNDTPYYNLTGDFSPDENWIAREMLRFEERYTGDTQMNGGTLSETGTGLQYGIDYTGTQSGTAGINVDGKFPEMGCDNSNSMHFWISGNYTGTPFKFTTTWSRGHYDFRGAEEVWFYVDFRDVNFDKISFNLTANEKISDNQARGGDNIELLSRYGTLYSTKAAGGANEGTLGGIYFQDEAGLWEETTMTDGCLTDVGGYRGFIRIPLKYFVAQETEYVLSDNEGLTEDWRPNNWLGAKTNPSEDQTREQIANHTFPTSTYNTVNLQITKDGTTTTRAAVRDDNVALIHNHQGNTETIFSSTSTENKSLYKLPVNPAGTPITEAALLQERYSYYDTGTFSITHHHYSYGYMLADGTTESVTRNGSTATVAINMDDGSVKMAIEDLCSAGFEVEGWSADSLNNSFDIDRIIFMRQADANSDSDYNTDTGAVLESAPVQFPTEGSNFAEDRGYKVGIYYDRTSQIPVAIANFIDEYLGDVPSLLDYDTIRFIDNAVATYKDSFPYDTVDQNLEWLGRQYPDEYNKYKAAKEFLSKYLGSTDGSTYYQAALLFEQRVELLPDPDFLDMTSDTIKSEVIELMGLYQSFDIGKLDLIGDGSESKFLQIYRMMVGNDIKAGHSIGAYPYIPFNNFESRYYLNETAFRYYNDGNNIWNPGSKSVDRNNVGSFTVYGEDAAAIVGTKGDANGWFPRAYNPASDTGDGSYGNFTNGTYFSRVSAQITANGFDGSKGASVNFDGDPTGHYNVISVSYQGRTADNLSNLPGLDLSAIQLNDRSSDGTSANDNTRYGGNWANSFVMYVDYSHVKDVSMNLQFIVDRGGTDEVFYFATGNASQDRIWMLNDDGDWVEVPINAGYSGDDCSIIAPNDMDMSNTLQYYKGFLRIPLSKFRNSAGDRLDNVLDQLTIKRVHVAFWSDDTTNIGESVTVDGMGFTYDPSVAGRASADPSAELISDNAYVSEVNDLDKYFAVQTDDATAFAQAVYSLDAHSGKTQFMSDYNNAKALYDALSDYQKSLPDVKIALAYAEGYDDADKTDYNPTHDYLKLYGDYDNLITTEDWASIYNDTMALKDAVDALPSEFKTGDKCTQDNRVSEDVYDYDTATIKYDFFGVTGPDDENIQKAIDAYEKGYMRMSFANRRAYQLEHDGRYTELINAYKTALRIKELISDRENIQTFYDKVIDLYPTQTQTLDGYSIPKDLQMKTLKTYTVEDGHYTDELDPGVGQAILDYYYMSIFAKTMLVNSNTATAKEQKNALMADALINVYINARTRHVTDVSTGKEYEATHKIGSKTITYQGLPGGIKYYVDMTHEAHQDITDKVSRGQYLTADELNKIEYLIRQYEAFKQRFMAIDPMYNEYLHMLMPFPSAEVRLSASSASGAADVTSRGYLFSDIGSAITHTINLAHVWTRLNHNVSLRVRSDLQMQQIIGPTMSEPITMKVDLLDGKTMQADNFYYSDYITTGEGGGTFTNRYSATDPARTNYLKNMQVQLESTASDIPIGSTFLGHIFVDVFDSDDIEAYNKGTLTDYEGNGIEPVAVTTLDIPVMINSSETYFAISFPASIEVPFKTKATEAQNVNIISALYTNGSLSLDLSGDNDYTMSLDTTKLPRGVSAPAPLPTIQYKVGNGDTDTYTAFSKVTVNGTGAYTNNDYPINIWVDDDQWNQSYVNSYIDRTLTFTAEYTPGSG